MIASLLSFHLVLLLLVLSPRWSQGQILSNGTSFLSGMLSSSVAWQSSGILEANSCPSQVNITDCLTLSLTKQGQLQSFKSTPRQRIEIFSYPGSTGSWSYTWKSYLEPGLITTDKFFHLHQLLRRDEQGGPVISLDAYQGFVSIVDYVRDCDVTHCPEVLLSSYWGKTILNSVDVTYGSNGAYVYIMRDAATNTVMMSYRTRGDMGDNGSLKFGLYRNVDPDMSAVRAYVGGYTAVELGTATASSMFSAIPMPTGGTSITSHSFKAIPTSLLQTLTFFSVLFTSVCGFTFILLGSQ